MPDSSRYRDPALVPLSHDHQRGLALCLRLSRWKPGAGKPLEDWAKEVLREIDEALLPHFALEEEVLFPAIATWMRDEREAIADILEDHRRMRALFERIRARGDDLPEALRELGAILEPHIRKEERVLFPLIQERVPIEVLEALSHALDHRAFCPIDNT
jgi:iron-sulfur cluster repair protein YtfE (RIC family)